MTTNNETLQHLLDFNASDIEVATNLGRDALETSIKRMENALRGLKRRLADFDSADSAHARADYLAWAANDLRNAHFNDMRDTMAEQAGTLKGLATTRVHLQFFSEK